MATRFWSVPSPSHAGECFSASSSRASQSSSTSSGGVNKCSYLGVNTQRSSTSINHGILYTAYRIYRRNFPCLLNNPHGLTIPLSQISPRYLATCTQKKLGTKYCMFTTLQKAVLCDAPCRSQFGARAALFEDSANGFSTTQMIFLIFEELALEHPQPMNEPSQLTFNDDELILDTTEQLFPIKYDFTARIRGPPPSLLHRNVKPGTTVASLEHPSLDTSPSYRAPRRARHQRHYRR